LSTLFDGTEEEEEEEEEERSTNETKQSTTKSTTSNVKLETKKNLRLLIWHSPPKTDKYF
jgi:hypothetical protein